MQPHISLNAAGTLIPVNRDITVGIVAMADFARETLVDVPFENYQTLKPLAFAADRFRQRFLSVSEMERLNRFKALKRQIEWLSGRFALKQLATACGVLSGGLPEIAVAYENQGAPYLVDCPGLSVSISHSGGYAAAALSRTATVTLGIDIEKMGAAAIPHVLSAAFTAREQARLQGCREALFYACWTAKEAYLKYRKCGFGESLKRVEVLDGRLYHGGRVVRDAALLSGRIGKEHALSLVYGTPAK